MKIALPLLARRYGKHVADSFLEARDEYAEVYRLLGDGAEVTLEGVQVQAIRPARDRHLINRTTQSGAASRAGAANAEQVMTRYLLGGSP